MGCDITMFVERRVAGGSAWEYVAPFLLGDEYDVKTRGESYHRPPFNWRSYGLFGFLADVRNYSEVPPISQARGVPDNVSEHVRREYGDDLSTVYHSSSWLSLTELVKHDYDQKFSDMRVTRETSPRCFSGSERALPGEERATTLREFLGKSFFDDLEELRTVGFPEDVRIVFWFDS